MSNLPEAFQNTLDSREPAPIGELRDKAGEVVVRWSADEVAGRPPGEAFGPVDREGVLAVQLSRGRGIHEAEPGFVGKLKAFWKGPWQEALFVELRGRTRVRVHAPIDEESALDTATHTLPTLRLDGSVEVASEGLLDLLAFLRQRGDRFLAGAPDEAGGSGRRIVTDTDPEIADLPALAWLPIDEASPWVGQSLDALALEGVVVPAIGRDGGSFIATEETVLQPGDTVLLGTFARSLAGHRTAAGVAEPLRLEVAELRSDATGAILLSVGAFGPTEHEPSRSPKAWRFVATGGRAATMVSAVEAEFWTGETPLDEGKWPDGVKPVAALVDGAWALPPDATHETSELVVLAGDRLDVAKAEGGVRR